MIFKKIFRIFVSLLISGILLISFSNPPVYIPRDVFRKKVVMWVVEGEGEGWDEILNMILKGFKKVTLRYSSEWISGN